MISYNVPINAQRMTIGVQGENNVREFLFDVSEWRQLTGDIGTAEMVVQRNGDSSPYATVITLKNENTVSWIPTDIDTAKAGAGKIELMWIANNQTIKTKIFLMKVDPSLPYAVPDDSLNPWASWMPGIINADAKYKGLSSRVDDLQLRQTSPYNFRGYAETMNDLPSSGNAVNDTYYVEALKYRVTWTGSAWQQSSMEETAYTDELSDVKNRVLFSQNSYRYDWRQIKSNYFPTGWRPATTTPTSVDLSTRYLTTAYFVVVKDADFLTIEPPDGLGVSALEYDEDGQYIRWHGGNSAGGTASHLIIKCCRGHKYKFNVGLFPTGDPSGNHNTDEYLRNVVLSVFPAQDNAPVELTNADKSLGKSHGHLLVVSDFEASYLDVYNESGVVKTVPSSDYIRIRSGDLMYLLFHDENWANTDFSAAEIYLYFYDENKNPVWDVLDHTDTSTGERNRVRADYLLGLNGFCFADIPAGYYVKIANANNYKCQLVIWDGKHFGIPTICKNAHIEVNNGTREMTWLPRDGSGCIYIPKSASFALAKPGYTFTGGYIGASKKEWDFPASATKFPAQIIRVDGFLHAGNAKNINITTGYNYATQTADPIALDSDLSDNVVIVSDYTYNENRPIGDTGYNIAKNIKRIMAFEWSPVVDVESCFAGISFKAGVKYRGIPYRSSWVEASQVGWHVTKHTFMNAINDPDSIFYHTPASSRKQGPYYSLVCSSFGTLVGGFQYPMSNFGMMKDPFCQKHKVLEPRPGEIMTNGYTHCLIPVSACTAVEDKEEYAITVMEQSGPITTETMISPGVSFYWTGVGQRTSYIERYQYVVVPNNWRQAAPPYDIDKYSITNGSARPHKGDRSVYTSAEDVLINIYDRSDTRLYYQEFTVTMKKGVPDAFSPSGAARYINIDGNQVTIPGTALRDGAIYGVWTSYDAEQSTAPETVEYFEWHDVSSNPFAYSITDGVLYTDSRFWYALCYGCNYKAPYRADKVTGNITVPCLADEKTITGETPEHPDYSIYKDILCIEDVIAVFCKGVLGAFVWYLSPNYRGNDEDKGDWIEPEPYEDDDSSGSGS